MGDIIWLLRYFDGVECIKTWLGSPFQRISASSCPEAQNGRKHLLFQHLDGPSANTRLIDAPDPTLVTLYCIPS